MAFAPFHCALGDSPEVELTAGATVDIAPGDDSVDSNRVRIVGTGTISSFGIACDGVQGELGEQATVTKRIAFVPTAPGITLHHNPPGLTLLGGVDRVISKNAFGTYASDIYGWWTETEYSQADVSPTKGGGALIAAIYYTASATITIPPGATRAWVRMWGGSGASGNGFSGAACSAGVGAPGYLERFLTGLTSGNTLIFTRGAAGVIVSGNGGNGSASILASGTQTIAMLTANGSNGTPAATGDTQLGSAGGTANGGDINLTGQQGGNTTSQIVSTAMTGNIYPGIGGVTMFAHGVNGSTWPNGPGNPGIAGGMIVFWFNDALS